MMREHSPGSTVQGARTRFGPPAAKDLPMIEWIVILLIVAAIASLLGFRGVAGASAGIAKILIFIVLIGILLLLFFGVIVFA